MRDPFLVTKVHDRVCVQLHTKMALLVVLFLPVSLFALGAGMMSVVIGVTPAMIKTNEALSSCMDFEQRIRKTLEGRILGASLELENLRQVNYQLIAQMNQEAEETPQPPKKLNRPAVLGK